MASAAAFANLTPALEGASSRLHKMALEMVDATARAGRLGLAFSQFGRDLGKLDTAKTTGDKLLVLVHNSEKLAKGIGASGVVLPPFVSKTLGAGEAVAKFTKSFDNFDKAKTAGDKLHLLVANSQKLVAGLNANGVALPPVVSKMLGASDAVAKFAQGFDHFDKARTAGDKLQLLVANSQKLVAGLNANGVALPPVVSKMLGAGDAVAKFTKGFDGWDKAKTAGDKLHLLIDNSQKLVANLKANGIVLPSFINNALKAGGSAEKFAQGFDKVDKATGGLGTKLANFAAGQLPSLGKGFMSVAGDVAKFASGGLGKLGSSLASVASSVLPSVSSAFLSLGATIEATPIGWIITGIAAVAAAGYLIYEYWTPIKTFFAGLWQKAVAAFKWAWKNIIPWIPGWNIVKLIIDHWTPITNFFSKIWNTVTGAFKGAWNMIKPIIDDLIGAVKWVSDKLGITWLVNHVFSGGDVDQQKSAPPAPRATPPNPAPNMAKQLQHTPPHRPPPPPPNSGKLSNRPPDHPRGPRVGRSDSRSAGAPRSGAAAGPAHTSGPVHASGPVSLMHAAPKVSPSVKVVRHVAPTPQIPVKGAADIRVRFENAPPGTRASTRITGHNPPNVGVAFQN